MRYTDFLGYRISKLTLGTVALGLDYGISNTGAKPSQQESFDLLSTAVRGGINSMDTASSYGNAESVLGSFLATLPHQNHPVITTKFRMLPEDLGNRKLLFEKVRESILHSLELLKLDSVPFCLFHMPDNLSQKSVQDLLPELLTSLKAEKLIDIGGVSVYHPQEVAWWIDVPEVQALQIPMNIMDHRLAKAGLLKELAEKQKSVFVRSVFLQGLFFMDPEKLSGNLLVAAPFLRQLRVLAESAGLSIAQLAFSYIKDIPEVTSIIFGAVTPAQVKENLEMVNLPKLSENIKQRIEIAFREVPEHILMPGTWKY